MKNLKKPPTDSQNLFVLGFFYGRWSMKLWFEIKKEEWHNKIESEKLAKEKENMEWAARRH